MVTSIEKPDSANRGAAETTGLSLVGLSGDKWIVADIRGELVTLGVWSFYRSAAVFGPATRAECETYIGERIGKRLGVGRHAPKDSGTAGPVPTVN
jgi:hypothetical protein